MSHRNSDSTHSGSWGPQGYLQNEYGYTPGTNGYRSRAEQTPSHAGSNPSYHQHHHASTGAPGYPYSELNASRDLYMQSTSGSSGGYPVQMTTADFGAAQHTSGFGSNIAQYNQQPSQSWMQTHSGQLQPHSRSMVQPPLAAPPVQYTSALNQVAPRMSMTAHGNYPPQNTWPASFSPTSESPGGHSMSASQATESGAEYVVPCPYNCGTVLTGVHAVGNMTRHLKSQNCVGSGKEKPRYVCPVEGCDKRYIRSDGLKVHLRKRHNISQPSESQSGSGYGEGGYGYS